ncbi:MAG: dienelactone hydrolase family protein [Gemmatimonadales bacterium]
MRLAALSFLVCHFLLATRGYGQDPERLSDPEVSPAVWGVLGMPDAPGPHAGLILLPGAAGWRPIYAEIARIFADSGFVVLALDYHAETGTAAVGSEDKLRKWPQWRATVRNAVDYVRSLPSVSGRRVGLVGYSRGAFLAVSVAGSDPSVGAVVDYFGGGGGGTESVEQEARGFPPLLILHGDADSIVPVRFAYQLRDAVVAAGGEVELQVYPGADHAFNAPFAPTYREEDAADAFARTIEFLRRRLGG